MTPLSLKLPCHKEDVPDIQLAEIVWSTGDGCGAGDDP